MKIQKFEGYQSGEYDYEFGGHCFVLARFKNGWNKFTSNVGFENDEFVPCMISGHITSPWNKQNFWIIGLSNSYNIESFEIMKGSDKGFQEMIELYSATKRYNI